MVNIRFYLKT